MEPNEMEPRAWSLSNIIMAAMGALVLLMLTAGFWSIINKIETGDLAINVRIAELSGQVRFNNDKFQKVIEDISRIDALQKMRLEKEYRNDLRDKK